jgi:uncharacterized Zn-finger protein
LCGIRWDTMQSIFFFVMHYSRREVQYCKLSQNFSSTGTETFCFSFQSFKLDSTGNESTYFVTDIIAKELLGEQRETMSRYQTCSTLFTHQRTAVKGNRGYERHFFCDVCRIRYTSRYNLDRHARVHTGERPFSCEVCKKQFALRSGLKKHLRVHTGERPFSGKLCKKTFTQSCALSTHTKLHTGERPFPCKFCNKKFTVSSYLERHLLIHSFRAKSVRKVSPSL